MSLTGTVNLMAHGPVARVVEVAAEAERLGFARCWLYDEGLATRDVHVTAAAVAAGTERILVGPGITNPYTRHPATTAMAIATLDEMSGGRAFAGIGAGGVLTLRPLAIERRRPAAAVEEMVATMRQLFAGETVDFDGRTLTYRSARLAGAPRPGIEIWVATRGARIADVGSRLADGVHFSYLHKERIGATIAAARRSGRPVRISYSTATVTHDAEFERARAELSFRLVDSPQDTKELIGMTAAEEASIRAALAAGGPAAAAEHVRPEWVDGFALVGSPEQCARELHDLAAEHAIDEFQVPVPDLAAAGPQLEQAAAVVGI